MQRVFFPASRVADFMVSRPLWLVAVLLGMLGVSAAALPHLRVTSGADAFLDPTLEHRKWTDAAVAQFGSEDVIFIAYRSADVFDAPTLEAVRELGRKLEALRVPDGESGELAPVEAVDSIATVKDFEEGEFAFKTVPLVPEPMPTEAGALGRIRSRVLANRIIRDNFVGEDGASGALTARLVTGLNDAQRERTVEEIRRLWQEAVNAGRLGGFHMTGNPVVFTEITQYVQTDTARFIPLGNAVMFLLMLVLLRRLGGALLATVNILCCVVIATAILPLIGHGMTSVSSVLSPLVMVLSASTMIHFLSELGQNAEHLSGRALVKETLTELLVPSALCAFTTAVGFASLASSSIPVIHDFAIESVILVGTTFVFTLALATLAALWRPASFWIAPRSFALSDLFRSWVERYCDLVHRRAAVLVIVGSALLVLCMLGIPRLVVDEQMRSAFGKETRTYQALQEVESNFGGTQSMLASIRANEPGRFLEPEVLRRLDGLHTYVRDEVGVDRVFSLVDHVKLMHRSFFGNDPAYERVPDTREAVAQLLLLSGDDVLEEWVDSERKWVRLLVRFREPSTLGQIGKFHQVDRYLREHFPEREGFFAVATGEDRLHAESTERLSTSMSQSMLWAFFPAYLFDRLPSIRLTLSPAEGFIDAALDVRYRRQHVFTADVERAFGRLRVAAEGVAYKRAEPAMDSADVEDTFATYVAGVDLETPPFFIDHTFHFFIEYTDTKAIKGGLRQDVLGQIRYPLANALLFRMSYSAGVDWRLDFNGAYALGNGDYVAEPELSLRPSDGVRLGLGVLWLGGNAARGFFAALSNNNRVQGTLRADF